MGLAAAFAALAPVFLLIALGAVLRQRGLVEPAFWPVAERLVYFVLFPALLVVTTASAELGVLRVLPVATAIVLAMIATALLALPLRPLLRLSDPAFSSVFQATFRMNTYIGLAAAQALWGAAGVTLAGLVIAFMVPMANLLAVIGLARLGVRPLRGLRLLWAVFSNPLIAASVLRFGLAALGMRPRGVAAATLRILGDASLALALLCVGAGLELRRLGDVAGGGERATPRSLDPVHHTVQSIRPAGGDDHASTPGRELDGDAPADAAAAAGQSQNQKALEKRRPLRRHAARSRHPACGCRPRIARAAGPTPLKGPRARLPRSGSASILPPCLPSLAPCSSSAPCRYGTGTVWHTPPRPSSQRRQGP